VPAQRQRIRPIECGGNIQIRDEKSPEYRVLVAGLPVEPGDFHMLALIRVQSKGHFATWVARLRQPRCDFQSDGAEQRWRNRVIHKSLRCRQRDWFYLAHRPRKSAEIAGKHGRRGNIGDILLRVGSLNSALISAKEEELILDDGASESSPELVALQRVALR